MSNSPQHSTMESTKPGSYYQEKESERSWPDLPTGCAIRVYNGEKYILPNFLVPSFESQIAYQEECKRLDIENISSAPRNRIGKSGPLIAAGYVPAPVDPGLSDREYLSLHAEVKTLQQSLGLSYKDAAHRLYMAEIEKLSKLDSACERMTYIQNFIDRLMVEDITPVVQAIDSGDFDNITWKNGNWAAE